MPASPPAAAEASGRPATDPAGPTGRLATWVAETTLDDVAAPVRGRAEYLVLDGIGCAVVGAQLPVSRIGVAGVTALDSGGDAALIGWGGDSDRQVPRARGGGHSSASGRCILAKMLRTRFSTVPR